MESLPLLSLSPLFADFSHEEIEDVVLRGEIKSYRRGEKAIHAGEPGRFLGIVLDGTLQAESPRAGQESTVLGQIAAGEYFGEISLVSGGPTTADVVAMTYCQVLQIPHQVMSEALSTHPQAMRHVARTITERLMRAKDARAPVRLKPAALEREAPSPPTAARILVVACGEGSLQYHYYDTDREMNDVWGVVEGIGSNQARHVSWALRSEQSIAVGQTLDEAARSVIERLTSGESAPLKHVSQLVVVGHRVPRGDKRPARTVTIGDAADEVASAAELGFQENRPSLAGIDAFRRLLPQIPQVAVFDTAFFATVPPRAFMYAVPYEWYESRGIQRYGYQGLMHEQAALLAAAHLKQRLDESNLITCLLGPISSVCAILNGHAIDISAGLTPLEGLPGSTTCGDIDPGLLFQLADQPGDDVFELARSLEEKSGLLGISGISGDLGELLDAAEAGNERAQLALDVLCYRVRKYIGAYSCLLGKLDALVLAGPACTALPGLRMRACSGLQTIGIELDDDLNLSPGSDTRGVSDIALPHSSARVLIVPTDESRMIASLCARAVGLGGVSSAILAKGRPIPIGISAHHVHLFKDHVEALFGPDRELTFKAPLSQPGQFACEETVDLVSAKGKVQHVRVLGPERNATQVELSRTECIKLRIEAPIRMSGDLSSTPGIAIEGPAGRIEIDQGVICARRHLHASPEEALTLGLRDRDEISVRIEGERSLVFGDVALRVHPEYRLDMHIDTDEANAAQVGPAAVGYIESIDSRS